MSQNNQGGVNIVTVITIIGVLIPGLYWLFSLENNVKQLKTKIENLSELDTDAIISLQKKIEDLEEKNSQEKENNENLKKQMDSFLSNHQESISQIKKIQQQVNSIQTLIDLQGKEKFNENLLSALHQAEREIESVKQTLFQYNKMRKEFEVLERDITPEIFQKIDYIKNQLDKYRKAEIEFDKIEKSLTPKTFQEIQSIREKYYRELEKLEKIKNKLEQLENLEEEKKSIENKLSNKKYKFDNLVSGDPKSDNAFVKILSMEKINERQLKVVYVFRNNTEYKVTHFRLSDPSKFTYAVDEDFNRLTYTSSSGIVEDEEQELTPMEPKRGSFILTGDINRVKFLDTLSIRFHYERNYNTRDYDFGFKKIKLE